jgi:hypothetical protein
MYRTVILLAVLFLSACGTVTTKLATRTPDPSLLVPCAKPAPLPAKPTGTDIDKALVNTTELLLDCSARHDGLIQFENAAPKN